MYRSYASTIYKLRRAVGSANFVEMGFNPFKYVGNNQNYKSLNNFKLKNHAF